MKTEKEAGEVFSLFAKVTQDGCLLLFSLSIID
jgi:hypothetical protein